MDPTIPRERWVGSLFWRVVVFPSPSVMFSGLRYDKYNDDDTYDGYPFLRLVL